MVYFSLLYVLSEWAIRLVMLAVIPRKRQPVVALAWLAIVFFSPWAGLILFLLFGTFNLPKRRAETYARHKEALDEVLAAFERQHPAEARPRLDRSQNTLVMLAEHLGHMPVLGGNRAELLADARTVFARMVEDIDNAVDHVHLLYYIYADDAMGRSVGKALERAVKRGVSCRLLVDAVGSRPLLRGYAAVLAQQGVEVRAALPVGAIRRNMARLDLRNHRKLCVVDGKVAYTGSHNLVEASYGRRDLLWHDLASRLEGPIVLDLQAVFCGDWHFETGELLEGPHLYPTPSVAGDVAVQVLPSGPNYPTGNYQRLVVAALHTAKKHVSITTPYFVPDEAFLQAMHTAALRGVEVDLIVPKRFDQILAGNATRAYFEDALEAGVHVHRFLPGLLHAKTMLIDDKMALIGSSNFDIRSFMLNFEINMVFYDPGVVSELRRHHRVYREHSYELTLEQWQSRTKTKQVLQNIVRLLSPVL